MDKPLYWSRASLRIKEVAHLHAEIIQKLGTGSECHKAGDKRKSNPNRIWRNSVWILTAPISENRELCIHLEWIAIYVEEHHDYLASLIARGARVDVYASYCCDQEHRGFGLGPQVMSSFSRLGIELGVSIC